MKNLFPVNIHTKVPLKQFLIPKKISFIPLGKSLEKSQTNSDDNLWDLYIFTIITVVLLILFLSSSRI